MPANTYDIRQLPTSDPANLALSNYAFSSSPKVPDKEKDEEYLRQPSDDVIFASYVDDDVVAKVGIEQMTMNVRGKVMKMGGISGVASMPVARRGGHIRALMNHSVETMHQNGQAVSTLYPFKASYYEKFGYAGWQIPRWVRFDPAALAPYLRIPKEGVQRHRLVADSPNENFNFLERAQTQIHGMSRHGRTRFDNAIKKYPSWFMTVHEGDEIVGGLVYKLDLDKEIMNVSDVYWFSINGKLQVLDFVARHADQVKTVSMPVIPGEEPDLWITDDGWKIDILTRESGSWGAPMGRVVTIIGLGGIGAGDGEAVISVNDEQAPWNNGTWTFAGKNGELSIREGGNPGGSVSINGLSALVFSGIDPITLAHRGWGEVTDETAIALKSIFPPVMPHLHEQF